jgi:hypothetical protein
MKLYELELNDLNEGMAISRLHAEQPYVPIEAEFQYRSGEKAFLEESIVQKLLDASHEGLFSHDASRIHRCDLEERSALWFTPETEATKNIALVKFRIQTTTRPAEVWTEGGGKLLRKQIDTGSNSHWLVGLAELPQGSLLRFHITREQSMGGVVYAPWIGLGKQVDDYRIFEVGAGGVLSPYKR